MAYDLDGHRHTGKADEGTVLDVPDLAPTRARGQPASLPEGFIPGLVGTVYDDVHFVKRVTPRVDGPIDFFWPNYVPPVDGMDVPQYSIRWTGSVIVPAGGATIGVEADDGAHLTIDSQQQFEFADPLSKFSPAPIPAGQHTIGLDHWNRLAGGRVRLLWQRPGDVVVDVPAGALCHAADAGKDR